MKQVNSKLALGLRVLASTLVLGLGLVRFGAIDVLAETLESSSYVIQFGNFNVTSGEKSNSNYAVTDTVGQTGAGPYGQLGSSTYFVGSGFQYIYPFDQYQFLELMRPAILLTAPTSVNLPITPLPNQCKSL